METSKIVDDLMVTLDYQKKTSPRSCFVVFSSREEHVDIVLDCIETVFEKIGKYQVERLDKSLKSGDSQYTELTDLIATCSFAIVILDGFRPNVLFEYGILKGLGKPCIVLLEEKATVDVLGFFATEVGTPASQPPIDMDKHFSDVKDRFFVQYNKNKPKQIRATLKGEYSKLKEKIEEEFLHMLFPHREVVEKELTTHLTAMVDVLNKSPDSIEEDDLSVVNTSRANVERIASEHHISLPAHYFSTLAHTYETAGDMAAAIAVIDSCLRGTPDDASLLNDKAFILRNADRIDDAIKVLDQGIKLCPDQESLWHNKGNMLDKLGKTEKAAACYKKAADLDSGCTSIHYHYGVLLYQKKDFASAVVELDKALELKPADPVFLLWKARTLHVLGNAAEASRIIAEMIAADPTDADAWFVLGQIEKNQAKALEAFQRAVQLNPDHGGALCSSAACLSNIGRYEEALTIFLKMQDFCPQYESCSLVVSNICKTLIKRGRHEKGIQVCDRILDLRPNDFEVLSTKAVFLANAGSHKGAIAIFNDLLREKPDDAELWYNQACSYSLSKKPKEALLSLRKAIGLEQKYERLMRTDNDFVALRTTKAFRESFPIEIKKVTKKTSVSKKGTRGKKR